MTLYRLYLTAEERQTLEGWRKKYKLHSPKLLQIQILLNSDESTGRQTSVALAAVLGTSTLPHKILPSVFTASEGTFEASDFSPSI